MATSGSQTYNGGPSSKYYLQTVWTEKSQDKVNNKTVITVKLYIGASSGWSAYVNNNSFSIAVSGETTATGSNVPISINGSKQLLLSRDFTIDHDSDGKKSVTINSYFTGSYIGAIDPGGFTATLDTIPRASSLTSSASMTAGSNKSFTISRASSSFSHELAIYLMDSGGATDWIRTEYFSSSQTSKTINWTDNEIIDMFDQGYGYWTKTKIVLTTKNGSSVIGSEEYIGTLSWPSNNSTGNISGDVNVGQTLSASISKASSLYAHEYQFRYPDGSLVATGYLTNGTSLSVTPSTSDVYAKTRYSKSIEVQLWIRTVLAVKNSVEIRGWTKEDTALVKIINSNPVLSDSFSYKDVNASVVGITENDQLIVSGKSTPRLTFGEAEAKNNALIAEYTVVLDGQSRLSQTSGYFTFGAISSKEDAKATLTVKDTRGFQSTKTITLRVIPYSSPFMSATVSRVGGYGDQVSIRVSGTFSTVEGKNTVDSISGLRYRHKLKTVTTYENEWTNLPVSFPKVGEFVSTVVIQPISNDDSFDFEIEAVDSLNTPFKVSKVLASGKPLIFFDTDRLSIGINMFTTKAGAFQVAANTEVFADGNILSLNGKQSAYVTLYDSVGKLSTFGNTSPGNGNIVLTSERGELSVTGRTKTTLRVGLKNGSYRTVFEADGTRDADGAYVSIGGGSMTHLYAGERSVDPIADWGFNNGSEIMVIESNSHLYLTWQTNLGFGGAQALVMTGTVVRPYDSGTLDLGSSGYRWKTIYAVNALNTSDSAFKEDIVLINKRTSLTDVGYDYVDINMLPREHDIANADEIYEFMRDMPLYAYSYKEVGVSAKQYGFMADQLLLDDPTNVAKRFVYEEDGVASVSTQSYAAAIHISLQKSIEKSEEQALEIEALKQKLKEIEAILDDPTETEEVTETVIPEETLEIV